MKNGVFWDIKAQFIPHRRHISSPLQSQTSYDLRFSRRWVKNAAFWDVIEIKLHPYNITEMVDFASLNH
jgi:hypothetical protein